MATLSGDISGLVFKRVVRDDMEKFSLDGQMLTVLMSFDGNKNIGTLARSLGVNMATIRDVVSKLLELELIIPTEDAVPVLGKDFMDYLKGQLSVATGPIAEVLIEDATEDLGAQPSEIPRHQVAELIDILSRQIPREEKRVAFQQAMLEKIKETEG
jgi:hypothetical protein